MHQLDFRGKGTSFFGVWIVNTLLTILTLGIYSFWARINVRKFFYENTYFQDRPFEFHATGGEQSRGFIMAILLIIGAVLLLGVFSVVLSAIVGEEIASLFVGILTVIAFFGISPFITVGKRRYLLARSSYRNIRFLFTGTVMEMVKINVAGIALTFLTLGLYLPFYRVQREQFNREHACYGSEKFSYDGEGMEMLKIDLVGLIFTVVTLGIYTPWWSAATYNYHWNHTSYQGERFSSSLTGLDILITWVLSTLVIVFTLGLGIPFATVMRKRLYLNSLSYLGEPDFEQIRSRADKGASALADGMAEAGEMLDSVGEMFG